jgi:hypothetical protein
MFLTTVACHVFFPSKLMWADLALDGWLLPCGHNTEGPARICGHISKKQVGFVELHAISIDFTAYIKVH